MYNKKGIEITFSWIFAIIAGTLIFLFFVGFAAENMDLFGKLTAMRVSEEMNSAFTGLKTGLVSTSLSFNKEVKLQFKCIGEKKEKLIVGYRSGKNLYDNLVFSPEELNGNEFLLMTKSWNVPYKVDNFIFISDKNRKFFLDGDVPDGLIDNLPDDFKVLFNTLKGNANKIVNFVSSGSKCDNTVNGNEININYQKDSSDNFYGTICGKDSKGTSWALDFYGDAMIYAAIFGDQFDCLYPLMEEKFKIMRDVYLQKISSITGCDKGGLQSAITNMDTINKIQTYFDSIDTKNKALIGEGCNVF